MIFAIALGFTVDLLRGRWAEAAVTDLVVELGKVPEEGLLRERLAAALGDPALVIAYWSPSGDGFVDERGDRVVLPAAGSDRRVTIVRDAGEPVAGNRARGGRAR